MRRSTAVSAVFILLGGMLGGCVMGLGGSEKAEGTLVVAGASGGAAASQPPRESEPAAPVEGFDPVTFGMVKISETLCVALDPYDQDKITAAVRTFANHEVEPKIEEDSATWTMIGPQGRVIVLERDPRPKKYKCKLVFTYGHRPTAVYWLDQFTKRFADAGAGQLVKLPKKTLTDGVDMESRLVIARGVPLFVALI